jgi:23S rRNA (pseudouridine1915-N3)-methyltransferase
MKVTLIEVGKTESDYLKTGIDIYLKRIAHYVPIKEVVIPALRNTSKLSEEQQKQKEGSSILSLLQSTDELILLDERGEMFSSVAFARFVEKKMVSGSRNLVFLIGGPYGFSEEVYARANGKVSLSAMTFSHQMVRLLFVEQFYRAMTILKGEPYHHE